MLPFRELPVTLPFLSFLEAAVLLYFCVYNRPLAPALDSIFWSLLNSDHLSHHWYLQHYRHPAICFAETRLADRDNRSPGNVPAVY